MSPTQDAPPDLREHRAVSLAAPWRVHLIAGQEHPSLIDRQNLHLVQDRQHVPLPIRPQQHRNALVEAPSAHSQMTAHRFSLDGFPVQSAALTTTAIDDCEHMTILLDGCTVITMDREIWIAVCAHRLKRQWRTVDTELLDEVAEDLWADERLREMEPTAAASQWLDPVSGMGTKPQTTR